MNEPTGKKFQYQPSQRVIPGESTYELFLTASFKRTQVDFWWLQPAQNLLKDFLFYEKSEDFSPLPALYNKLLMHTCG